jgi:hypothetical protein
MVLLTFVGLDQWISPFVVVATKYQRLGNVQRKEIYLAHIFGSSRAWEQFVWL